MRLITLLLFALLAGCGDDQSELIRQLESEHRKLRAENAAYKAELDHLENTANMQASRVELLKQDVEELHAMLANSWPTNCDEYGFTEASK